MKLLIKELQMKFHEIPPFTLSIPKDDMMTFLSLAINSLINKDISIYYKRWNDNKVLMLNDKDF